ncbi:MAG: DNA polymerase III subunit delta, partial [Ghiorsea sp.]|nr:DNA polymerase III subunit delta [Ghiorsea sp.]
CHDLMRLPATIRSRCMLQVCSPLNEDNMQHVLHSQNLDERLMQLAMSLGQGSPGRVASLLNKQHAQALLEWQDLLIDLEHSDIGLVQKWLDKHVKDIPHDLIAKMVVNATHDVMLNAQAWQTSSQIYSALLAVGSWPKEVIRHTLRPAPALMSSILQLRSALKNKGLTQE